MNRKTARRFEVPLTNGKYNEDKSVPSPRELWAETCQLYEVEGLSLSEIAQRLGIAKQTVHHRLERAGVEMHPRSRLDRQPLERLYVVERKTVAEIAAQLGTTEYLISQSLRHLGIAIRKPSQYRSNRFPGVELLKVGGSVLLPRPNARGKWQSYFYQAAAKCGFKVTVRAVNDKEVLVTRVA